MEETAGLKRSHAMLETRIEALEAVVVDLLRMLEALDQTQTRGRHEEPGVRPDTVGKVKALSQAASRRRELLYGARLISNPARTLT